MIWQRRNNKLLRRVNHHTTNMSTIDSAQQEMPTQSEENNQVIQHRYDALGRGDTDALFASMHKGDPQERDRRVLRNMIFIASTGLAMIIAATSSSGNDVNRVSCEKGADVLHRHHEHAFDGFHTVKRDVWREDDVRL